MREIEISAELFCKCQYAKTIKEKLYLWPESCLEKLENRKTKHSHYRLMLAHISKRENTRTLKFYCRASQRTKSNKVINTL